MGTHAAVRALQVGSISAAMAALGIWAAACDSDGGGGSGGTSTTSSTTGTSSMSAGGAGGAPTTSSSSTTGVGGSGAGGSTPDCPPAPAGAAPALKLTQIATGLSKPVLATSSRGDTSRLYIVEQTGLIKIIKNGTLLTDPFLSTVGVSSSGAGMGSERGLLGLAFHPDYETNGRFFIYYTAITTGAITVAEYARSAANPDVANTTAVKKFIEITDGLHLWGNHNGGMLAFGADGHLYAGVGDGGGAGDPNGHGQDISLKLAKILRFDVDNHPTPPPGNLPGGDPDIWDYGLRNPWRFSFDRCTGDLYIGDVGQGLLEEIDVEPAGQGNLNYGWSIMEGTQCYGGGTCDMTGITLPVAEYPHTDGGCSVTGGYVYRGSDIPDLVGTYFYADYCSNRVWTLVWENGSIVSQGEVTADLQSDGLSGISSFGQDARGELYITDLAGGVYRIDAE